MCEPGGGWGQEGEDQERTEQVGAHLQSADWLTLERA
jgi:hypothetical protein